MRRHEGLDVFEQAMILLSGRNLVGRRVYAYHNPVAEKWFVAAPPFRLLYECDEPFAAVRWFRCCEAGYPFPSELIKTPTIDQVVADEMINSSMQLRGFLNGGLR